MPQLDGTFGLDFLFAVLRLLDDRELHCGVCPDCTENKCLTKAHGCRPVGCLMEHSPASSCHLAMALVPSLLCSPLPHVSLLREGPSFGRGAPVRWGPELLPQPQGQRRLLLGDGCTRCNLLSDLHQSLCGLKMNY